MSADQMAYLPKSVGDSLVAQGCASLDRNSGVYYVDRLPSPERDTERLVEALRKIADGRWNTGTGRDLSARGFAREFLAEFPVSGESEDER